MKFYKFIHRQITGRSVSEPYRAPYTRNLLNLHNRIGLPVYMRQCTYLALGGEGGHSQRDWPIAFIIEYSRNLIRSSRD